MNVSSLEAAAGTARRPCVDTDPPVTRAEIQAVVELRPAPHTKELHEAFAGLVADSRRGTRVATRSARQPGDVRSTRPERTAPDATAAKPSVLRLTSGMDPLAPCKGRQRPRPVKPLAEHPGTGSTGGAGSVVDPNKIRHFGHGVRAELRGTASVGMCDARVVYEGRVEPGFELVAEAFAQVIQAQRGNGAAVAVWQGGSWLVDLLGGTADSLSGRSWEAHSIVQPYSVTKPFVAVCALLLVEQGKLELDAAVQRYWPEFTAPATVRQMLAHQAGVVALDTPAPTGLFYDWAGMCDRLAAQPPAWDPGTAHGESALFYGHLVGELVRRIDGRSIGRFLRDEVCGPVGLDFSVGLSTADQARAVELTGLDDAFRADALAGKPDLYRQAIGNPPGAQDAAVVNGTALRAAEIPAVNGHGTARAVAGFYAALVTGRLLAASILAEATSAQASGVDRVLGHSNTFGLGFGVENGFGMGGLGGSFGGANRDGYVIGFVTGSMGTFDRVDSVENALRSCLGLPSLTG